MAEIRPEEISAILRRQLSGYEKDVDIYEVGTGKLYSVNQIAKMIFGDTPPECKVEVNGEIFESQTFGGIEFTRKLGWNHTTELENYLKNT